MAVSVPQRSDRLAFCAMVFAIACLVLSLAATRLVRGALQHLGVYSTYWEVLFVLVIAAFAVLLWPALRARIPMSELK